MLGRQQQPQCATEPEEKTVSVAARAGMVVSKQNINRNVAQDDDTDALAKIELPEIPLCRADGPLEGGRLNKSHSKDLIKVKNKVFQMSFP